MFVFLSPLPRFENLHRPGNMHHCTKTCRPMCICHIFISLINLSSLGSAMLSHSRDTQQETRGDIASHQVCVITYSQPSGAPNPTGVLPPIRELSTTESRFLVSFRDIQKPYRHFCHHREAYNRSQHIAFACAFPGKEQHGSSNTIFPSELNRQLCTNKSDPETLGLFPPPK